MKFLIEPRFSVLSLLNGVIAGRLLLTGQITYGALVFSLLIVVAAAIELYLERGQS